MFKTMAITFVIVLLLLVSRALGEPPRVVSTIPANGQTDIDPAATQIRIVFDQPMSHSGHSIVGGGPTFPTLVGQPRWVDDRTMIINVKLRPDHDYRLSINSHTFTNFRNRAGEPAVPYAIAFSTAAGGDATLSPDVTRESIDQLRRAIDQEYSYRDLRGVDWEKLFDEYTPKFQRATTAKVFARHAAAMLSAAKDMHVLVKAGDSYFPTHRPNAPVNFNLKTLSRIVPQWRGNDIVYAGQFDDGIVYLMITTWDRSAAEKLELAYETLASAKDAKGLIIDVRPNSGGDETLAQQFAGCFIDEPHVYSKNTIRKSGEWHGPFDRVVQPNPARQSYSARVVVLMGPQNMSSCESFLLMMREVPGCKLIGERSYGSSGNPKPHELANGVIVLLPSWKDMLPDGTTLEGVGVEPYFKVPVTLQQLQSRDKVLDEALKLLRDPAKGASP